MGTIVVELATGLPRVWVSGDVSTLPVSKDLAFTDPAQFLILEATAPPPANTHWNGTAWVPMPAVIPTPTIEERVAALEATTASLATKVGMATIAPVVP